MNATLLPVPAPLSDAESNYDSSKHDDHCLICSRGMTAKAVLKAVWVEMTTSRELISVDHVGEVDSQGMFPVGAECAKRIPKQFRRKLEG